MHLRLHSGLVPGLLLAGTLASPAQELSKIPRQDFWVTDGAVNAIAVTNDRVFIGGDFRYVGPYTGGGVPVDVNTMQPVAKYPKVNGSVHAVEPDGQGGWFIGGLFTTVGGRPRTNLAHITAAGEVNTNWVAHATGGLGRVTKLALDQDTLYAVGEFTHLGGLPRHRLGAVLAAGGAVTAWAPRVETNVLAIAVSPSAVYLGGKFFSLNGVERRYVGAVDKTTGETTPWNPWDPDVNPIIFHNFVTNAYPQALALANGWVIFPGRFNGGFAWVNLAAFRENDGSVVWSRGGAELITDLKVRDDKLYVAGRFTSIGGDGTAGAVSRTNLAAIELVMEGRVTDWVPAYAGVEQSLAFHGNSVFAVGWFENLNPSGGRGVRTNANYLVRLDMETGATLEPFRPLNNGPIWAVAAQGDRLFLGGGFTSLGGVSHEYLAELDGRDGTLQPWTPQPSSSVSAPALADGRLYVGGWFHELGGTPRQQVGAYDLNGLTLLEWNPEVERSTATFGSHPISELVPLGDSLLVAGEFQTVGGQPRTNLALVNRATGEVLDWRADTDGQVAAAALAGGHLYVGGTFSRIGGVERRHLARLDPGAAAVDAWDPGPDARVTSLSANSSALYLSGFFTKIGETPRAGLAAFDLARARSCRGTSTRTCSFPSAGRCWRWRTRFMRPGCSGSTASPRRCRPCIP
jgi:trimeric autotransporter adhesin